MGILSWVVLGLIAGLLARWLMPGRAAGGLVITIVLGVVGALLGGFIATQLGYGDVNGLNLYSVLVAVLGAVLVLFVYGLLKQKRLI